MAQILMLIEEYIVKVRKEDTLFMGFHPLFAKAYINLPMTEDEQMKWLKKSHIAVKAREEFIAYMAKNLPHVTLTEVFDNVPVDYIEWPYLGTLALDIPVGSKEQKEIEARYENEQGQPKSLDAVLYIMSYEDAKRSYEKRLALDID